MLSYIAKHADEFREGTLNYRRAIQMGSMYAVLGISTVGDNRVAHIAPYEAMEEIVHGHTEYTGRPLHALLKDLGLVNGRAVNNGSTD